MSPLKAVRGLEIALLDVGVKQHQGFWRNSFGGVEVPSVEFGRFCAREIRNITELYFDNLQSGTVAAKSEFTQMCGERWEAPTWPPSA